MAYIGLLTYLNKGEMMMQALVKKDDCPGLSLQKLKIPEIQKDEVLIKVRYASVCGTDVHIYNWDKWAQKEVPLGTTLGHEFVGYITEKGRSVIGFEVGDLVTVEGHGNCLKCYPCLQNLSHLCEHSKNIGIHINGGFAGYVKVSQKSLVNLNDLKEIDHRFLSLLDPLGNAVHCIQNFDITSRNVLIMGAGPIGLMSILVLKFLGVNFIAVSDYNEHRLQIAKKIGADLVINLNDQKKSANKLKQAEQMVGFNVGLEMSGSSSAFQALLNHIAPYGRIILLGIYTKPSLIDLNQIIFKGLRLKGVYGRSSNAWRDSLFLLKQGLDLSEIITHEYFLHDFDTAFKKIISGEAGKVIFNMEYQNV